MKILAHRGLWNRPEERNTWEALTDALEEGYGIETDLRDADGEIVISHDPARRGALRAEELFRYCREHRINAPLALNIKADGIQPMLEALLKKYPLPTAFYFDMSVPEMLIYDRLGMPYFTRQSDIERMCVLYDGAQGIWIDGFSTAEWITAQILETHLAHGKRLAVISEEIHGRTHERLWSMLKDSGLWRNQNVMLCTDLPEDARQYFT